MVDALSRRVKIHHILAISYYKTNLEEYIKNIGHQDEKYKKLKDKLQQGSQGNEGKDYCFTEKRLIKLKSIIYVLNKNNLRKLILNEFHAKTYFGHLGYSCRLIQPSSKNWATFVNTQAFSCLCWPYSTS